MRWSALTLALMLLWPGLVAAQAPPEAAVAAWWDNRPPDAEAALAPALAAAPDHPGLRLLRVEIQASWDPMGFVLAVSTPEGAAPLAAVAPAPTTPDSAAPFKPAPRPLPKLGDTPADAFEAACRRVVRARIERGRFRGDGDEPVDAFLGRMATLSQAALQALDEHGPAGPWTDVLRAEVATWAGEVAAVSAIPPRPADTPEGAWQMLLLLGLRERGMATGPLTAPHAAPPLLAQRYHLQRFERELSGVPWPERVDHWRALQARITEPTLQDNVALGLAREILQRPADIGDARPLLEGILAGPWRDTTPNAARSLAALLRREGDDEAMLATYEALDRRRPPWGEPEWRQWARAEHRLGRYQASFTHIGRLLATEYAEGRDYLYLADASRVVQGPEDALKLVEFATAVRERELAVEGALKGWSAPVIAGRFRLFELSAAARHARIFPHTFVALAGVVLMDALVLGLGLAVLAAWPAVSRRVWPASAGVAVGVGLIMGGALLRGEAAGLSPAPAVAWLGYGIARAFLLTAAALVLAAACQLPGLGLGRGLARAWRSGRWAPLASRWAWLGPVVLVLELLVAPVAAGLDGSSYLGRLPAAFTTVALGASGAKGWEGGGGLLGLAHGVSAELLARGALLGLVVWGLRGLAPRSDRGRRWATVGGVLLSAALFAAVVAGGGEPAPDHFWFVLAQGLVLGGVAVTRGLDAALVLRALVEVLWR